MWYFVISVMLGTILSATFLALYHLSPDSLPEWVQEFADDGDAWFVVLLLVVMGAIWVISIPVAFLGTIVYYIVSQVVKQKQRR